jgi:pyrroline-5-carboxylate reductase
MRVSIFRVKRGNIMVNEIGACRIGFIGGGNMAEAFIGAFIKSGIIGKAMIRVSDVREERLHELRNAFGINATHDNHMVFRESDVVVIAVKPQTMDDVLGAIGENPLNFEGVARKLVISIAAGIPIRKIEKLLYASLNEAGRLKTPVIRVMPNTPALVCEGMSGMRANRYATREDMDLTRKILESVGQVQEFPEEEMDAVTALSGSGPAYVFFLAECMIDAGLRVGFAPVDAVQLTMQTIQGALALMKRGTDTPEELRRKVTSPGGTTQAAFKVLQDNRVKELFIEAIEAAKKRSEELSR